MAAPPKSLRGHLLLDGGRLAGSWFHRTVVLICQHDADGAFGLVLNRPAGAPLGDAVVADLPDAVRQLPLFVGGPVQPGALSYLHHDTFVPEASVMANLDLGHSLDDLRELADGFSPTRRLLVFAGYAGWSPGQLDDELARQAWLVHPATPELVFADEPRDLWQRILRQMGGIYRLLASSPEDLSAN